MVQNFSMKPISPYSERNAWAVPAYGEFGGNLLLPLADPDTAVYEDGTILHHPTNQHTRRPWWSAAAWRVLWNGRATIQKFKTAAEAGLAVTNFAKHPRQIEFAD